MIAFVALVPVIKEGGPRASSISFVYLVIILSAIPNFLAIASSLMYIDADNMTWKDTYLAFQDSLFLISFSLSVILLLMVVVLLIHFLIRSH